MAHLRNRIFNKMHEVWHFFKLSDLPHLVYVTTIIFNMNMVDCWTSLDLMDLLYGIVKIIKIINLHTCIFHLYSKVN